MATQIRPTRRRYRAWLSGTVGAMALLAVVGLIAAKVPTATVAAVWHRMTPSMLLWAAVGQVSFVSWRAMRFRKMAYPRAPWLKPGLDWVAPTALYSMTASAVPGGLGELTLPAYFRARQVPTAVSVGMLVGSRLFDLGWSVILVAALGLMLVPAAGGALAAPLGLAAGLVLALALAVMGIERWGVFRGSAWDRLPRPIQRGAHVLSQAMATVNGLSAQDVTVLSLLTWAMKASSAFFYWVIARGLGFHPSFWQVAAAMMIMSLFLVIPMQAPGGFGTGEAWWTIGLTIVGVPLSQALILSVAFQVLNLTYMAGLGALAAVLARPTLWPVVREGPGLPRPESFRPKAHSTRRG